MALAIAEVLEEWRRAERILEVLPAAAPELESVEDDVRVLQATYPRLTESTIPSTEARLRASLEHVEQIRARLAAIHAKYGASSGMRPDGEVAAG